MPPKAGLWEAGQLLLSLGMLTFFRILSLGSPPPCWEKTR